MRDIIWLCYLKQYDIVLLGTIMVECSDNVSTIMTVYLH